MPILEEIVILPATNKAVGKQKLAELVKSYPFSGSAKNIQDDLEHVFVLVRGSELIGFAHFVPEQEKEWKLDHCFVRPGFEGKGLATRLVYKVYCEAVSNGCEKLLLTGIVQSGLRLANNLKAKNPRRTRLGLIRDNAFFGRIFRLRNLEVSVAPHTRKQKKPI
jgi:GNAT superfamily N-acetyltransferase